MNYDETAQASGDCDPRRHESIYEKQAIAEKMAKAEAQAKLRYESGTLQGIEPRQTERMLNEALENALTIEHRVEALLERLAPQQEGDSSSGIAGNSRGGLLDQMDRINNALSRTILKLNVIESIV